MNIAELFVRLRGDTSDLDRKLSASERQMLRLHGSTAKLESGFRSAQFQTGRLGNQFASLAGQIAGVHPIVGNLAQVMGNFAVGGLLTVGILGATAIFATFYDTITKGAKAAKKETDAFIKSLVDETKAAYNASVAGRELALMRAEFALQDAKKSSGLGAKSLIGSVLTGGMFISESEVTAQAKRVADATTAVAQAQKNLGKTWEDSQTPIKKTTTAVDGLKFSYNQLRDAIDKVRAAHDAEGMAFWKAYADRGTAIDEEKKAISDLLVPAIGGPVDISSSAREAGQHAQDITDNATRNSNQMRDAIWGAGLQSASIIVNALNIGGGGKGSSLGGALGGTAGFAAGYMIGGPVGGAIGSTIGNIAGSFFGGLFDSNKKAVNDNTNALRVLTATILNAPSGFRVEPYRYGASDPKQIAKNMRTYQARGGAPLLAGIR